MLVLITLAKSQWVRRVWTSLASPSTQSKAVEKSSDLIETHFNTFANRADPDQAALVRAA